MVKPLWGFNYGGDPEALTRSIKRDVTDPQGRFRMHLPLKHYFDSFVFLSIANSAHDRTFVEGEFFVRADHVITIPADADWSVSGSVRVFDGVVDPLKIKLLATASQDIGDFGNRLSLLAEGVTERGTGRISLPGIVDPIRLVEGPIVLFATSVEDVPVAKLRFESMQSFEDGMRGGIMIRVHRLTPLLPLPADIKGFAAWQIGFVDKSVYLQTSAWRPFTGQSAIDVAVQRGRYGIHARTSAGDQILSGILGEDGAIEWFRRTPEANRLGVSVFGSDGRPVVATYVTCEQLPIGGSEANGMEALESAITNNRGVALFHPAPGSHRVTVRGPAVGVVRSTRASTLVEVPCADVILRLASATVIAVDVTYEPPVDRRGQVTVLMQKHNESAWRSMTLGHPHNSNILDGVEQGRYRVMAFSDGYEVDTDVLVDGAGPLRLILKLVKSSEMAGNVTNTTGEPVVGGVVRCVGDKTLSAIPWRTSVTGTDGHYHLWVGPGALRIEASAGGYQTQQIDAVGDHRNIALRKN